MWKVVLFLFYASDYLNDNVFVEAFLYEKKNGYFFLSFLFSKKECFFSPQISVLIKLNPLLGKTSLLSMVSYD
jgi:hypothetical protein